jgi:hypothetical protein
LDGYTLTVKVNGKVVSDTTSLPVMQSSGGVEERRHRGYQFPMALRTEAMPDPNRIAVSAA